jgi:WD40 repeat protein
MWWRPTLSLVLSLTLSCALYVAVRAGMRGSDAAGGGAVLLLIAGGAALGFRRALAQRLPVSLLAGLATALGLLVGWWVGSFWQGGGPLGSAFGLAFGLIVGVVGAAIATARNRFGAHRIFLSYRRGDSSYIVGRLRERLIAHFGRANVFMDIDSIPAGDDFRAVVVSELRACHVVLSIIGEDWSGRVPGSAKRRIDEPGDFVRVETEEALRSKVRFIPILVEGARIPSASELPESLAELPFRNGLQLRPDPDFSADVSRLVSEIKRTRSEEPNAARSAGTEREAPPRVLPRRVWNGVLVAIVLLPAGLLAAREALRGRFDVRDAQVSPDGGTVLGLQGEYGSKLRAFDLATGQQRTALARNQLAPTAWFVRWSPNGKMFAIGHHDGIVRVHAAANAALLGELNVSLAFVAPPQLAWSADGELLAVVDDAGLLRLWNAAQRKLVAKTMAAKVALSAVAFSRRSNPALERWFSGTTDGRLYALDRMAAKAEQVATVSGEIERITSSPDGGWAFVETTSGQCLLFDASHWGQPLVVSESGATRDDAPSVVWSLDGGWVAVACGESIDLMDLRSRSLRDRWRMKWDSWDFGGIVGSPQRDRIYATGGNRMYVWDVQRHRQVASFALPDSRHDSWVIDGLDAHGSLVLHEQYAPTFLLVGLDDGKVSRKIEPALFDLR